MFKNDLAGLTVKSPGGMTDSAGIMTKQSSPAKEPPADKLARILSAQSREKFVKFLPGA
jgi:hypothetical protein